MLVLAVDDETKIREVISDYLRHKGKDIITAESGNEALEIFEREKVDFIILDLMLPDISGEEICKRIRKSSDVPIIMLTARSADEDMLNGLDIGADDYIRKPFSLKELYMRMEVILRRTAKDSGTKMIGELSIDTEKKRITKNGSEIILTASEWKLIETFIDNYGKVMSRERLIDSAFGMDFDSYDRAVDTHIKNLRKKIETDPHSPEYIKTVHGLGYKFEVDI